MAEDLLNRLLDGESERMQAYAEEVRQFFRALSDEIEAEFATLFDRLLNQQFTALQSQMGLALASTTQADLSGIIAQGLDGLAGEIFGDGGDSIVGRALQAALAGALGSIARTGRFDTRRVLNAGASAAGRVLSTASGGMRLSASQQSAEAMRGLRKAQRDS